MARPTMLRFLAFFLTMVWSSVATAQASAEHASTDQAPSSDKERARVLATRGIELFHDGKPAEAYERIARAEAIFPALTHRVYLARALAAMGRWVEAKGRYEGIGAEPRPAEGSESQREAYAVAEQELKTLDARIPRVRLLVEGDFTEVRLDGEPVEGHRLAEPLLVDPGEHRGEIYAGERSTVTSFTAKEGERHEVTLVAPRTVSSDGTILVPAIVAYGVGGAALVIGAVTGGLSLSKVSSIEANCIDGHCPPEDEPEADEARVLGTVSTVSFVVAGVAVATGVALTIWPPGASSNDAAAMVITPAIGPGWMGVQGSF